MLPKRDPKLQRVFGASVDDNMQEDVELLMRSWQAIVRSHRLLERQIHKPAPEPGMASKDEHKR
jgi:hypothetical protein